MGVALVEEAVLLINKHNFNPKYIHIEASSGILKNKKLDFVNAVRPGIITYGYELFSESNDILNVDPICKLISSIVFIKDVKKEKL